MSVILSPAFLIIVPFVLVLAAIGYLFQPPGVPARGRTMHPRYVGAIRSRIEDEQPRRPTGYQSPAWTVQTGATR